MGGSVTFWTEGGPAIGMGHISRCVNLAKELDALGVASHFLVNSSEAVHKRLRDEGICHVTYPVEGINPARLSNDVVVIDTKKDISKKARVLKDNGKKVVAIDNLTAAGLADIAVMPTPFEPVHPGAHAGNVLSGSDYVIIGRNFHNFRSTRKRVSYSAPLKVLVTMGGADPNNLAETVVGAIEGIDSIEVTVVAGPAYTPTESLESAVRRHPRRMRLLRNVTDMAVVMGSVHVAFTAVGTTLFELAYMGVPSIVMANYPEDSHDLVEVERLGIGVPLRFHKEVLPGDLREAVRLFMDNRGRWLRMSEAGRALIDGKGGLRIARAVQSLASGINPLAVVAPRKIDPCEVAGNA